MTSTLAGRINVKKMFLSMRNMCEDIGGKPVGVNMVIRRGTLKKKLFPMKLFGREK